MNQRLRLGFIGGGQNSAVGLTHRIASQMDGRWQLLAGAFSRHEVVNRETGSAWGVDPSRVYATWQELINAEAHRLDGVAVLTPTPQHAEQISVLLEAGVPVISEKAMVAEAGDARAIAQQAREAGRFLAVTYNYSGYPMVRELRARMRAGELGRIVALHVEMPQEGFLRRDSAGRQIQPQEWRQRDGHVPTVSLDLGSHTHHLVRFLLGSSPVELVALQSHHGAVRDVVDYVNCIARYPDAVDVSMWFGKCALGNRNGLRLRVYGEQGSAEWVQANPEVLTLADAKANIRLVDRASPDTHVASERRYERFKVGHPAGFLEAFGNLYVDLADALEDFRSTGEQANDYVSGADEAVDGLTMLGAAATSSRAHEWVSLASTDHQ